MEAKTYALRGFNELAIECYADEVLSIGDFILTGGEIGALAICNSIARQIKGVLGNSQFLQEESFQEYLLEAPVFSVITQNLLLSHTPIPKFSFPDFQLT